MQNPDKKVFVKTYGCQMNVYDSERMRDVLTPLGYAETTRKAAVLSRTSVESEAAVTATDSGAPSERSRVLTAVTPPAVTPRNNR